jgi:hypothetical protein
MSLAAGTALHNGHYVIDALLESAPNGDLYWGTHVVTGMRVFIQIFPVNPDHLGHDLASLMARLEGVAFAPQSPLPNPFQLFPGEDHTLCLTMGTPVGLPWTSRCGTQAPMTPKQALSIIRSIADSVLWLKEQGITGLDLSPNRIWLADESDRITLTGLPQSLLNCQPDGNSQPDTSVQFLARLLYSLLVGELPADSTPDDLRTTLNRRLPTLSPLMAQAIVRGSQPIAAETPALSLQDWLNQLPDAVTVPPTGSHTGQLVKRLPQEPVPRSVSTKRYAALAGTASLAAIAGITLGTVWRLNAQSLPGAIQFDPDQSFPSQVGWSGDRPDPAFDTPFVPAQPNPMRQEDWVESEWDNEPEAETWEAPVEAAEWTEDGEDAYDPAADTRVGDESGREAAIGDGLDPADAPVGNDGEAPGSDWGEDQPPTEPVDNAPKKDLLAPENLPQDVSAPSFESHLNNRSNSVAETASPLPSSRMELESKALLMPDTASDS